MQKDLSIDSVRANDFGPLLFSARIEVTKHISKKNDWTICGRGTKKFIGPTPEARSASEYMVWSLRSRASQLRMESPLRSAMFGVFWFYFPKTRFFTKLKRVSKNLPDLSNLYELPQDCLTKAGVIEDDTHIKAHDGSRLLWHDKDTYELEINLFEYRGTELLWPS